jgi:AraC-like DNA-binding protein
MILRISKSIVACVTVILLSINGSAQVTFVIDKLPLNTPLQDTIFIAGSFNDWRFEDPAYMLTRRLDGKYAITLPPGEGTIEYKFNRGGWSKWETDVNNNQTPNRKFSYGNGQTVFVAIDNWQDVGGAKSVDLMVFYFFGVGVLSILSTLLILRIKNPKRRDTRLIVLFLGFVGLSIFGRVLYEVSSIERGMFIELLGDVFLFLSGPLWYFAIAPSYFKPASFYKHLLPASIAFVFVLLKLLNLPALGFLALPAFNNLFNWDTVLFFGLALISNVLYFVRGRRKAKIAAERLMPQEIRFLKHMVLCGEVFGSVLMLKVFLLLGGNENLLSWYNRDFQFLAVSFFPGVICYYAIRHEDVFRSVQITLKAEEAESLKKLIHETMKEKRSFKDPHLTLNQLSEILNIKPHLLSKILNECYQQNFRDFVNRYRVEEFIELAKQDTNKKYTFLALANEVGFNSKSTFNVAFKKVFQQSPRDFFKANKMLEHFKKDQESLVL